MRRIAGAILAVSFLAPLAFADEELAEVFKEAGLITATKACPSECSKECSAGCPIEAAMAKLPKMTYKIGTEETCCSAAAAELAKKSDKPMQFVVAKKAFKKEGEAMVALATATEKYVADFTKTSHCSTSGKYTVAGKELCCEVMAGQRAELAKKAMKKVEMAYLVGDKECHCPTEATKLAKETGKDKLFVVAGEKTCCSVDARLKLAQAKYKAAVAALAKADAPEKGVEKVAEKS